MSCPTPYSSRWEWRCKICGGLTAECNAGCCDFNACLCGAQAENWRELRIRHLWFLTKHLLLLLWYGLRYNDWWWFLYGWRGK